MAELRADPRAADPRWQAMTDNLGRTFAELDLEGDGNKHACVSSKRIQARPPKAKTRSVYPIVFSWEHSQFGGGLRLRQSKFGRRGGGHCASH
jgi:hypothetical protein